MTTSILPSKFERGDLTTWLREYDACVTIYRFAKNQINRFATRFETAFTTVMLQENKRQHVKCWQFFEDIPSSSFLNLILQAFYVKRLYCLITVV